MWTDSAFWIDGTPPGASETGVLDADLTGSSFDLGPDSVQALRGVRVGGGFGNKILDMGFAGGGFDLTDDFEVAGNGYVDFFQGTIEANRVVLSALATDANLGLFDWSGGTLTLDEVRSESGGWFARTRNYGTLSPAPGGAGGAGPSLNIEAGGLVTAWHRLACGARCPGTVASTTAFARNFEA